MKRKILLSMLACFMALFAVAQTMNEAVDNSWMTFTYGGNALWFGQTVYNHDGIDAAQSGDIGDNQEAWFQTTVSGSGIISFWWSINSEARYDFIEFYIDNILQPGRVSGVVGWQYMSFEIGTGSHTLKWRYMKDVSLSTVLDCAWIDQISFVPSSPSNITATNIVKDAFDLSWNGNGHANWNIEYGLHGFTKGTGSYLSSVTSNPIHFSDLIPETSYDFYLQTVDNYSNVSSWVGPYTVTTDYSICESLNNCDFSWSTGGTSNWITENNLTFDGVHAVQSPTLADNQEISLSTTLYGKGSYTFYWKVSSETNNDWLAFYDNGSLVDRISGDVDWALYTYEVPGGSHQLTWKYIKNGSYSSGYDCGWIDQVNYMLTPPSNLSVSNVSLYSAEFAWTENGTATEWDIEWGPKGFTHGEGSLISGVTSNPYVINHDELASQADYEFYVRSVEPTGTKYEWSLPGQFTSTYSICEAVNNCDLEWQSQGSARWELSELESHDGVISMVSGKINDYESNNISTVVNGQGTLSFWWKVSSEQGYDFLSFYIDNELITKISGEVDWRKYTCEIGSGEHELAWVYQKDESTVEGDDAGWLDAVQYNPENCQYPTDLASTNVAATNARIGWVENGDTHNWDIEWGLHGFTQGTGTLVSGATTRPYILNALTAGTMYDYYVRANCSSTDHSKWSEKGVFATYLSLPTAVDNANTYTLSGEYNWFGQVNDNHDGVDAARSGFIKDEEFSAIETTVTGPVDVSFWWKVSSEANYDFLTFYIDGNEQSNISGILDWQRIVTSIPAGSHTLSWEYSKDILASAGEDCGWVDEILVSTATCAVPNNLSASNITSGSADISWTENGTATSWDVTYGPVGTDPEDGTLLTGVTNPVTISPLDPGIRYQVYVRAACGASDHSIWSQSYIFNTDCGDAEFPLTENFDGYNDGSLPLCWNLLTYGWTTSEMASYTSNSAPNSFAMGCQPSGGIMLVTPYINEDISSMMLKLDVLIEDRDVWGSIATISIGTLTDNSDMTSLSIFHNQDLTNGSGQPWVTIEVDLSAWNNTMGNYIGIMVWDNRRGIYTSAYIDNIELKLMASVSGAVAENKTYDGTTDATISGLTLSGTGTDDVSIDQAVGQFDIAEIGTGIPVSAKITLTGADAYKYTFAQPTHLAANITPKDLTVSASVPDKQYDATDIAPISSATLIGIVGFDDVKLDNALEGTFPQTTLGTGLAVTTSMTLEGLDAYNYSIIQPTLTGNIVKKNLTVDNAIVETKQYDGTKNATISGAELIGIVGSDDVTLDNATVGTFNNAKPGTNKSVSTTMSIIGSDIGNYNLIRPTLKGDIVAKELTVINAVAANKTYDGTTSATISGGQLDGKIGTEVVTLGNATTGNFANSTVGQDISVITNMTITGADAGNYTIIQPNLTANINAKQVTVVNAQVAEKIYDGTRHAAITGAALSGVIAGETLTLVDGTVGEFAHATAGVNIPVTTLMMLSGSGSANYELVQPVLTGTIKPKELAIVDASANDKEYDGTNNVSISNARLSGVVGFDDVALANQTTGTFSSVNAGQNISVTSAMTIAGADAFNYTIQQPVLTANILPKVITVANATASNKVYDGTNTATISGGAISGVISGDVVNLNLQSAATFSQTGVGTNIPVIGTFTISGTASANYQLVQPNLAANITAKPVTVSISEPITKQYDGKTSVPINGAVLSGIIVGDHVNLINASFGNLSQKNAGTGLTVETFMDIDGDDATNYSLVQPSFTASITAKPIEIMNAFAQNKPFDGTNVASIGGAALTGIIGSDKVTLENASQGTFAQTTLGENIAVTSQMTLSGLDANNYSVIQPALSASILQKVLTIGGSFTVNSKVYDATTNATIATNNLNLVGVASGSQVSLSNVKAEFATPIAGTDVLVNITSADLTGNDAGNYHVSVIDAPYCLQDILPLQHTLTINVVGHGKVVVNNVDYTSALSLDDGSQPNLVAVADIGWTFDAWSGDITSTSFTETLLLDANKTVTVNFREGVGVNDDLLNSVTIGPNPFTHSIIVKNCQNIINMAIYNMVGEKLMDVKFDQATEQKVNLDQYNSGVYMFEFELNNGTKVIRKLVKQD